MPDPTPTDPRVWQGGRARTAGARPAAAEVRRRKILILAGIILALLGALVGLLFYLHEPPHAALVVVRIDQYRDGRLPVSAWSAQDRAGLRGLGLPERNTFTSQEKQLLAQELQSLGKQQSAAQPLLVYLGAYAVVRDDGAVALLPADANLDDPATWLPVKDVLAALQQCPVRRRLLLLDLTQPCVVPRAGVLAADVAERLKPLLETAAKDDPGLQILTACAPGQVSHASEELGHSVFAHYLIQGLSGRADGFASQKHDGRVSVKELTEYVKTQVDRWAWHNLGARQTPEFFGTAADYELVSVEGKQPPAPAPLPREYPEAFRKGWGERDRWWNDREARTRPRLYLQTDHALLHAEGRWRAGADAAEVEDRLRSALAEVRQQRAREVGPAERGEPRSLAQAVARGQKAPAPLSSETLRQFKELGDQAARASAPKATEQDMMRFEKARAAFLKKFENKPFDLAWSVFAAAVKDDEPKPEHLRCWYGLLRTDEQPPPDYAELHFLQRLAELPAEKPADWPAAAVPDALRLAEVAEQAEAARPGAQPWLKDGYDDAVRRRREAEALLFSRNSAERQKAAKPLADALHDYRTLQQQLQTLNDADRTLDDALVFLPGYVGYVEHDPSRETDWAAAVQTTRGLGELLAARPDAARLSEVLRRTTTLRNSLKKLREPLDSPLVKGPIADSRPVRSADAMEMRALLRLPGLTAPQRQTIWANWREIAGKLHEEAVRLEANAAALPPPDDARAARQERERALLRARLSLALLRLEKSADADKVTPALAHVTGVPQDEAGWEALRRELRSAWKGLETKNTRP